MQIGKLFKLNYTNDSNFQVSHLDILMTSLRKRVTLISQLCEALLSLTSTYVILRNRFLDSRMAQLDRVATAVEMVTFQNEWGNFPATIGFVSRLCNTVSRIVELYRETPSNLHKSENSDLFDQIKTTFDKVCDEVVKCMDHVNFPSHQINTASSDKSRDIIKCFSNVDGTQDLCSGVADLLKTVLLQEGNCTVETFRRYILVSSLRFPI
jgi:hypothetical protein